MARTPVPGPLLNRLKTNVALPSSHARALQECSPGQLVVRDNPSNCSNLRPLGTMLRTSAVAHILCLVHVDISRTNATFMSCVAAPLLLGNRPALHPISEARIAIVRVGWSSFISLAWCWAALSMDIAAPLLLVDGPTRLPLVVVIGAIEWVNRPHRWLWRSFNTHHLWHYTAHTSSRAAISLLADSPNHLAPLVACVAPICARPQQPQEQRKQQEETREAYDACEIPSGTSVIPAIPNVFVACLQAITSLTGSNIIHGANAILRSSTTCTVTTCNDHRLL